MSFPCCSCAYDVIDYWMSCHTRTHRCPVQPMREAGSTDLPPARDAAAPRPQSFHTTRTLRSGPACRGLELHPQRGVPLARGVVGTHHLARGIVDGSDCDVTVVA